jgi:type VI secretion system protein ImpG
VLERFFGLYASANSFTELVIKRAATDREWTRWPPRAGERALI